MRRGKATRKPTRYFYIYCEGAKTEPNYFKALEKHFNKAVKLATITAGVPMSIAEKAVAKVKELKKSKDSFEQGDQVWAVFDRDEHPKFSDAIAICESKGVSIGRSNPCFEIWLILHEQDYDRPDDRHEVCDYLRGLRPEYDPRRSKTCNCAEMIGRVEAAEDRATRLLVRRSEQGDPHGRPSTTVGQLTAAIRDAAEAAKRT